MKPNIAYSLAHALLLCVLAVTIGCDSYHTGTNLETAFRYTTAVSERAGILEILEPALLDSASAAESDGLTSYFNETGTGAASVVKTGPSSFRVLHKHKVSGEYAGVESVTLSPDGRRLAFVIPENGKFRMVIDGRMGRPFEQIGSPVFTPDSRHLAYKVKSGALWRLIVDEKLADERFLVYGEPRMSKGLSRIIIMEKASEQSPYAIVAYTSDLKRTVIKEIPAQDVYFDQDVMTAAAIVVKDNKKRVVVFTLREPGTVREGAEFDEITQLVFDKTGRSLAYVGQKGAEKYLVLDGQIEPLSGASLGEHPVISPNQKSLGTVLVTDLVYYHQAFMPQASDEKKYDAINELTFAPDGRRHVYTAEKKGRCFVVVNGKEGPPFDRVVSPRFSPDGRFLTYRARQDGKRFLVVADADGRMIRRHPAFDMVFEQVYTADGKSVAYGVKDGNKLAWRVEKLD
ncbi:PD40 domain-containing protein [Geotalea uraniireducens]|uniref:Uncharacterized protein n=1 Tax=Geotalea uraniireducens (strain Rf4) TaxID=351605 RepID=A5GCI7_GEOUR|nr:PD40 domain-containing protein [Geotalea uraniireducens]ABQ24716.1 hypothetical protein Gura_0501 [Geotalea uraniireducens Rf4]